MMILFRLTAKRSVCSTIPRFFFSCASTTKTPNSNFMVPDYLVATFGFSSDKAAKVSKPIAHLKSSENPDSVRRFLKDHGFSDAHINKLITWRPKLLCSSPENTLYPNLRALRHMGLSTSALNQIILYNPNALLLQSAVPRITFWMDFLGGDEAALIKTFVRNPSLIDRDINQGIAPKISLLQTHGFSNQEIRRIVCTVNRFIISKISGMEDLLNRTKELGFQPGSAMFLQGLLAMTSVTRAALKKRMDLLNSFGWSEDDFFSAVRNAPLMVALKEENLRTKMGFLLGEARCAPSYIASHPILLTYSLEKRLRPRYHVLQLLEIRGLFDQGLSFVRAIKLTNNQFVERYIIPYKEEISGCENINLEWSK